MSIDALGMALNPQSAAATEALKSGPTTDPKKLAEAAKQFEALMISQMMKSTRESSGSGWLNDGDQTGEDTATGMAEEQFAQAMASSGGLGLARMIVSKMSQADSKPAGATPAFLPLKAAE